LLDVEGSLSSDQTMLNSYDDWTPSFCRKVSGHVCVLVVLILPLSIIVPIEWHFSFANITLNLKYNDKNCQGNLLDIWLLFVSLNLENIYYIKNVGRRFVQSAMEVLKMERRQGDVKCTFLKNWLPLVFAEFYGTLTAMCVPYRQGPADATIRNTQE